MKYRWYRWYRSLQVKRVRIQPNIQVVPPENAIDIMRERDNETNGTELWSPWAPLFPWAHSHNRPIV